MPSALVPSVIETATSPLTAALRRPATIGFDHVSHHHQRKAEWTNRVMFGVNGLELALLGGLALLGIAAGILPNPFGPMKGTTPPTPEVGAGYLAPSQENRTLTTPTGETITTTVTRLERNGRTIAQIPGKLVSPTFGPGPVLVTVDGNRVTGITTPNASILAFRA